MNTYRVYVLDTREPLAPNVSIAYVRGEKYGDAWKASNAILNGEAAKDVRLFSDPECKVHASAIGTGAAWKTAKVEDMKPRNTKLDKAKLTEILNDPKATNQAKLAAIQALAGVAPAAATA